MSKKIFLIQKNNNLICILISDLLINSLIYKRTGHTVLLFPVQQLLVGKEAKYMSPGRNNIKNCLPNSSNKKNLQTLNPHPQ